MTLANEIKISIEALDAQLKAEKEKAGTALRKISEQQPKLFATLICEAILNTSDKPNPFTGICEKTPHLKDLYAAIATGVLRSIRGDNNRALEANSEGYIKLQEIVMSAFCWRKILPDQIFSSGGAEEVFHGFFEVHKEEIGYSLSHACWLIYHGIPLYHIRGTQYCMVPETSHDYIYLKEMGRRDTQENTYGLPDWTKQYYFKEEHLKAHRIFFKGDFTPEEVPPLREALRSYIGVTSTGETHPGPGGFGALNPTRLMKIVEETVGHYSTDSAPRPERSWPKSIEVIAWLRENHGLSERQAKAVDIITRPDTTR